MRFVFAAFCLVLLLAGCGGRFRSHNASAPVAPSAPVAKRASLEAPNGCGLAHASGVSEASIQFGGLERTYRLAVPKQYDPFQPTPLVLNFHGLGSNARQEERYIGIVDAAETHNVVVVTPNGTGEPRHWTLARNGPVDDAGFVRALIDSLTGELCIDAQRVYAMGISDGAFFSSTLACDLNDRLAAVAVVAGEPYVGLRCAGKAPMPILAFHGTADSLVPFEGGVGTQFNIPLRSARDNMKDWGKLNGCAAELKSQRVAPDVVVESYEGCRNGADVQLYVIEDGGHVWPGAVEVRPLGRTTQSINATELSLKFFEAHARP